MLFQTISANKIDQYIGNADYFIIDLRSPQEFCAGHIKGALNIPYEQLERFADYPKEKKFILYCERGGASMMAAKQLGEVGYQVITVIGGVRVYRGCQIERC